MISFGWAILFKSGCLCSKESIVISGTKYFVKERIAQGYCLTHKTVRVEWQAINFRLFTAVSV